MMSKQPLKRSIIVSDADFQCNQLEFAGEEWISKAENQSLRVGNYTLFVETWNQKTFEQVSKPH